MFIDIENHDRVFETEIFLPHDQMVLGNAAGTGGIVAVTIHRGRGRFTGEPDDAVNHAAIRENQTETQSPNPKAQNAKLKWRFEF